MRLISFRTSYVLSFTFCPMFIIDVIHNNVMPCFQLMNLGSRYLGLLDNTYCREMLLIMLKSSFVTWPAGLYINVEHGQVNLKRLSLEVVNGEILKRVFVEDIDYARNSDGIRDYRNSVIFYIGRYVRFD